MGAQVSGWIPVCTGPKSNLIDGFRFDLMARHDVETMNAIRAALDALPGGEDNLMYGEPWQGRQHPHGTRRDPRQQTGGGPAGQPQSDFSADNTRDAIKGGVFQCGQRGLHQRR